ncbi:MAG: 5-deoxy-glucuronate isomerase [Actinophytocola sp.]|uniref:5-deoxy-glucuronate isomerase n=1 Tax=Actinophytocola sp. TaxID=1872138 RepID=UPI0013212921|nr:5-deoxy-glucuronate isomerase [Actinophytocola sp.]MPZ83367.1 5-deoxy-glucuronate isomerase [Actinophytocola sp.]
MTDYYRPAGSIADDRHRVVVTPRSAGWDYSGLRVLALAPGTLYEVFTEVSEMLVLPLSGECVVEVDGKTFEVLGRTDVFSGPTDFVYLPREASAVLTSSHGAVIALPSAVCRHRLPARYVPAADVPVELRGAGGCSRQVNNFCTPDAFEADRLIACEVLTPGGNWSSYPPHKHDEVTETECELEEIYYFQVARDGIGYQRVYDSGKGKIDVTTEVRTDDVVLIPHGWHGPSMAAPGYDLYYLNVMAGPGDERAWLISDDPAHTWVRDTWADQKVDPRLPFTR